MSEPFDADQISLNFEGVHKVRKKPLAVHAARLRAERDALQRRVKELEEAVRDLVGQFACWSDGAGGYTTGGLSALEEAFEVLGWDDPHPCPDACCDEPGCLKQTTCGIPIATGKYRMVCGDHYAALRGEEAG